MRTTRVTVKRALAIGWLLTIWVASSCSPGPGPSAAGSSPVPTTGVAIGSAGVAPATAVGTATAAPTPATPATAFVLTSSDFEGGGSVPRASSCDGPDLSPGLAWTGVPTNTVSLVLLVDDLDAGGFVHWIVLDLPGAPTGALPAAIAPDSTQPRQGRNDFGRIGWGGPCPPSGTHRYRFRLYALDGTFHLAGHPDGSTLRSALDHATVLGRATIEATYQRR